MLELTGLNRQVGPHLRSNTSRCFAWTQSDGYLTTTPYLWIFLQLCQVPIIGSTQSTGPSDQGPQWSREHAGEASEEESIEELASEEDFETVRIMAVKGNEGVGREGDVCQL